MKMLSKTLLLFLTFNIAIGSNVNAAWSFFNVKNSISNLFKNESIQQKIETTFAHKWHYAAAGLFLLPACIVGYATFKKYLNNKDKQSFNSSTINDTTQSESQTSKNSEPIEQVPSPSTGKQTQTDRTEDQIQDLEEGIEENYLDDISVIPSQKDRGQLYFNQLQDESFTATQKMTSELLDIIVSLMHYFYDLADQKNQKFNEGAFIIEDKDHKVFNVMLAYVKRIYGNENISVETTIPKICNAYPRPSSHLEKYYLYTGKTITQQGWFGKNIKKQPEFTHYGIDVYGNENLPIEGIHHILFGKVDESRTFIRMEPHGLKNSDYLYHAFDFIQSKGRKFLPAYFGSDDEPTMRKERVPQTILTEFKSLIEDECLVSQDIDTVLLCKKAEGLGICFMIKTLKKLLKMNIKCINDEWKEKAKQFIVYLEENYDNLETRIGREVILTQKDFNKSI